MEVKISIIVPCYNMEKYIEETILSILNQQYPNLELIVVDGGSSDNTLSILSKYKEQISLLISEKDEGQYNAINKGFSKATGEILAWLNADDVYFPWTLAHVANFFNKHPKQSWISGSTSVMNGDGIVNGFHSNVTPKPRKYVENGWFSIELFGCLQQEGMFWRKELWEQVGGLDEKYKLAADFELWTKFAKYEELVSFGIPLACFRSHDSSRSKLMRDIYEDEIDKICENLKKPSFIVQFLGRYSLLSNLILKKFTFSKSLIYYFSPTKKEWLIGYKFSHMSFHSFSRLFFMK
ncbi:MAG: glycosyltransferase family 2 protein [Polaribacter sp.]|jgi:glycosyltransferase involved in cell wall biosynthesis|nr:glycosyltransferase family 2 protein [Polaribacter sp.]